MSIANSTRLLLCIVLSLIVSVGANAYAIGDTSPAKSPSKEIIIVSYDDFTSTDLTSLVSYVTNLHTSMKNMRITIKNYGEASRLDQDETLKSVVTSLAEVTHEDTVVVQQEEVVSAAPYFTITLTGTPSVQ